MVMGLEAPDAGAVRLGEQVRTMYVDQSRDGLDPEANVADAIAGGLEVLSIAGRDVTSRQYASWYGFKGADQQKKVGVLSGGELRRRQKRRERGAGAGSRADAKKGGKPGLHLFLLQPKRGRHRSHHRLHVALPIPHHRRQAITVGGLH